MRSVTSVEAQNRFGELIDAAQREPVSITRRGRTVAFVVSPADLEELIDARRGRAAAVAAYDEYLGRVSGRLSAEAAAYAAGYDRHAPSYAVDLFGKNAGAE